MITERKKRRKNTAGFTLIELLVVITIIAILGAVVAPKLFGNIGRANLSAAKSQMKELDTAATSYHLAHGKPISSLQDLVPEFYDSDELPSVDPWGGNYSLETRSDGSVRVKSSNYDAEKSKQDGGGGSTATIGSGK